MGSDKKTKLCSKGMNYLFLQTSLPKLLGANLGWTGHTDRFKWSYIHMAWRWGYRKMFSHSTNSLSNPFHVHHYTECFD